MSDIIYGDKVWWYCKTCGDEGESDSQGGAERQAARHECSEQEIRS